MPNSKLDFKNFPDYFHFWQFQQIICHFHVEIRKRKFNFIKNLLKFEVGEAMFVIDVTTEKIRMEARFHQSEGVGTFLKTF